MLHVQLAVNSIAVLFGFASAFCWYRSATIDVPDIFDLEGGCYAHPNEANQAQHLDPMVLPLRNQAWWNRWAAICAAIAAAGMAITFLFQIILDYWAQEGDGRPASAAWSSCESIRGCACSAWRDVSIQMTGDRYGNLFPRGDDDAELAAAETAYLRKQANGSWNVCKVRFRAGAVLGARPDRHRGRAFVVR